MEPEVRRRKKAKKDNLEEELVKDADVQEENVKPVVSCSLRNEFWLTRIVYLRFLAGIYFVAFLIGYHQNRQLVGDDGLLPAKHYLQTLAGLNMADPWRRFLSAPSLLWLAEPWNQIDPILDGIALVGMLISMIIFLTGAANFLALLGLWMLYHSLVNVGQNWYSFGWESQLLETGFLAMWIVPLWTWSKFPREMPTPLLGIAGHRWLIMRIMIGAGLIKIRGDPCWRDLTCMNYFFETQPNPNPQSWLAHQAPEAWHKFETVGNHVVELMSPWLTIMPFRWAGMTNGFLQVLFQVVLISTGNLSFLNWLTIVPSIWFFDDLTLSALFSKLTLEQRQKEALASEASASSFSYQRLFRKGVNMSVGLMLAYLSIPIVTNLISPNQIMNTSFEPFRIVNTYGAFGSVTKERTEIIFQATSDIDPASKSAVWLDYEFKCKPGNLSRAPCLISPYHYRLDWLMWFAAFQSYQHNPWLIHLAGKMLDNDPVVDSLLAYNPFKGSERPPRFVQALHYEYKFTRAGDPDARAGRWWTRRYRGQYLPPVDKGILRDAYTKFGWKWKKLKTKN